MTRTSADNGGVEISKSMSGDCDLQCPFGVQMETTSQKGDHEKFMEHFSEDQ